MIADNKANFRGIPERCTFVAQLLSKQLDCFQASVVLVGQFNAFVVALLLAALKSKK